jgi:hypothetical protein
MLTITTKSTNKYKKNLLKNIKFAKKLQLKILFSRKNLKN